MTIRTSALAQQHFGVLIVGAGHAGAHAAIQLRQQGYIGAIAIVGAEPDLPYERPPLSKEYLKHGAEDAPQLIRPASYWESRDIAMILGQTVVHVDPLAKVVATDQGIRLGYGTLIWAAGCDARKLNCPGASCDNVHSLRTRSDADRLIRALPAAGKVAIVGSGYIGLEAAASLRSMGRDVTIIEAAPRALSRVTSEAVSRFVTAEHERHGVSFVFGATVASLEGEAGHVARVVLSDGKMIDADLVLVGIGVEPATGALCAAGADCGNGVVIDDQCRTSLPDIYAIGDCALHRSHYAGGNWTRIESVQNANDQATCAVLSILGKGEPYKALPWFWSNQYDLRIQSAGLPHDVDAITMRGAGDQPGFSVLYTRNRRLVAIDAVNAPRDYVQGRALIASGASLDLDAAQSPDISLKDCAQAAFDRTA